MINDLLQLLRLDLTPFTRKFYNGWLRRLNGWGSSKHLICAALFIYNAFTQLNVYGGVCKQKQTYIKTLPNWNDIVKQLRLQLSNLCAILWKLAIVPPHSILFWTFCAISKDTIDIIEGDNKSLELISYIFLYLLWESILKLSVFKLK